MKNEFLKNAQHYLSKGQISASLKTLKENIHDVEIRNQILQLEIRFNSLNGKVVRGTIDSNDAQLEENRISNSILFIISNLAKDKNFLQPSSNSTSITTPPTNSKFDPKWIIIGILSFALLGTGLYMFIPSKTIDPCEQLKCMNGGVCNNGKCDCPDGFTGDKCQSKKSTPNTVPPKEEKIEPIKDKPTEPVVPVTDSKPDLIAGFKLLSSPPMQGQKVLMQGIVKNKGDKDVGKFDMEWWATHNTAAPAWKKTFSGLKAGQQKIFDFAYAEGYKSWYVKITSRLITDPEDAIDESDETNNIYPQTYPVKKASSVIKRPDLKITKFQMKPDPPIKGKKVYMQAVIENLGNADAKAYEVQWWATHGMNAPSWKKTFPGLAAGKKEIFSFSFDSYNSWYGRITSKLVVDSKNSVRESNENNNVWEKTHAVRKQ